MFDSFLGTFRKSLTSFKFYPSLLAWPLRRMILYFLSLTGALAFLALWIQLPGLILGLTELTDWAVRELPSLRFEGGRLEISGQLPTLRSGQEEPYLYDFGRDFAFAIDPEGKVELSQYISGIHLKKDQMIFKARSKTRIFPYPKDFSLTVSSFTLMHWRDILLWILPVVLGFTLFFNLSLTKGVEAILLGSLGFFWARWFKKDLSWKSCFFVSVAALTPALTFSFLASVFGLFLPFFGLAYYVLYLIFFLGGLKVCVQALSQAGPGLLGNP